MAVIIDSGIWIGFYNNRDEHHYKAVELMKEINTGTYGNLISTDYIIDESLNYCLVKYSPDKSLFVGEAIMSTTEILKINQEIFDKSWDLFKLDKKKPTNGKLLSFTDCTTIIIAKSLNIEYIATFDSRFKKYINTVET